MCVSVAAVSNASETWRSIRGPDTRAVTMIKSIVGSKHVTFT
jgi:hypothetical protein